MHIRWTGDKTNDSLVEENVNREAVGGDHKEATNCNSSLESSGHRTSAPTSWKKASMTGYCSGGGGVDQNEACLMISEI